MTPCGKRNTFSRSMPGVVAPFSMISSNPSPCQHDVQVVALPAEQPVVVAAADQNIVVFAARDPIIARVSKQERARSARRIRDPIVRQRDGAIRDEAVIPGPAIDDAQRTR